MANALVIEDNIFYQRILTRVLKDFKVVYAETGAEALVRAKLNAPDLVFLDVGLPDVKGTELIEKLKHIHPPCFIVMVTGDNTLETIQKSLNSGASGYIIKPYSKSKIDEVLHKWRMKVSGP